MESYISAEQERRRQGQIFATADELRLLRTLNARANAMRRMAGNKARQAATRLSKSKSSTRVA